MDVKRPAEPVIGSALELIAQRLRSEGNSVTQRPLPKRWVELLQHLNEVERRNSTGGKPAKVRTEDARSEDPEARIGTDPEPSG
jgi:hypothetical protein